MVFVLGTVAVVALLDVLPVVESGVLSVLLYLGIPAAAIAISVHAGVISFRCVRESIQEVRALLAVPAASMASIVGGLSAYIVLLEITVWLEELVL